MSAVPELGVAPAPLTDARLERLCAATLQRNVARPTVDLALFDPERIRASERAGLLFVVAQLGHIEKMSPRNLAQVARVVPLPAVRACFAAQVHDEVAHGRMLDAWLARAGGVMPAHPAARLGVWAGEQVQQSPWLGIANVTLLIEFYASCFLDALAARVEEPLLRALIAHIQKDESRHKAIAVQSLVALREGGFDRRLLVRALGPLVSRGTLAYFRDVFGTVLARHARALDLAPNEILERSLDEAHAAQARGVRA